MGKLYNIHFKNTTLEAQAEQRHAQAQQHVNLQLVIGRLEEFSAKVTTGYWFSMIVSITV